jgi:predicted RNase H-like nuclease (RuvC/YqgF family)
MDTATIQKRLEMLEKSETEYRTKKEMLQDTLKADEELTTLEDKLHDAKIRYQAQKQALLNEPNLRKMQADMKDLALEIKETKQLLGDELIAYFMKNNSLEYIDPSGQKRRFLVSAKFVGNKPE